MTRTILLADDSVTIQKVVELAFVQNGYDVQAVGGGDEAIARLEDFQPDAVIADVHMPGASGYDVCKAAKARYPGVPVVLLIGAFETFDPAELSGSGAEASLKKPFDSRDLFSTVEKLLAERPSPAAAASPEAEPDASSPAVAAAAVAGPLDGAGSSLSDAEVDRIARRVVELLGDDGVREVAWEVIPDLAEIVIRDRLRELESQVE